MKLYNRQLMEIENAQYKNKIDFLAKKIIDFISKTYGIDEKILLDKYNNLSIVERMPNESHLVEYNGQKITVDSGRDAASFVTHKAQSFDGEKWHFENALYISLDGNGDHTIEHELIHYFSSMAEMKFNTSGIGYDKSGIKIVGYDKFDSEVDSSLKASGLNEGITEMLANKLDGVSPSVYYYQVCITDILTSNLNNKLIKAYFLDGEQDFKEFLLDFNKRQSSITSKELISILPGDSVNEVDMATLKGCMEYSLSYCNNLNEFYEEKKRLLQIVQRIKGFYYKDSKGIEEFLLKVIDAEEEKFKGVSKKQNNENSKMKFIEGFINAYDITENEYQRETRTQNEKNDIERVKYIAETGFAGPLVDDIKCNWIIQDDQYVEQYSQKQVSAMARLLKAAKELTENEKSNSSSKDYLLELTKVPDIDHALKQLRSDLKKEGTYIHRLREEARRKKLEVQEEKIEVFEVDSPIKTIPSTIPSRKLRPIISNAQVEEQKRKEDQERYRRSQEEKRKREEEQRKKLDELKKQREQQQLAELRAMYEDDSYNPTWYMDNETENVNGQRHGMRH